MKTLSHKEYAGKVERLFKQSLEKFNSYTKAKKKEPAQMADAAEVGRLLQALDAMGKRRTLELLYFLLRHDRIRFNELHKTMNTEKAEKLKHIGTGRISSRTLSIRLRELEKLGIVERKRYAETPPRVEYSLTEKGRELKLPLSILYWWSLKWSRKQ